MKSQHLLYVCMLWAYAYKCVYVCVCVFECDDQVSWYLEQKFCIHQRMRLSKVFSGRVPTINLRMEHKTFFEHFIFRFLDILNPLFAGPVCVCVCVHILCVLYSLHTHTHTPEKSKKKRRVTNSIESNGIVLVIYIEVLNKPGNISHKPTTQNSMNQADLFLNINSKVSMPAQASQGKNAPAHTHTHTSHSYHLC